MEAVVWSDYICPWCWLGRDRTDLLRQLGVTIDSRPFELHPGIPVEGRRVRPDGRLAGVFALIGAECEELDLPFRAPERVPNSRRALEITEVVRQRFPASFEPLDDAFYRAHWVQGLPIDDPDVQDGLIADAGADVDVVHAGVDEGIGAEALVRSMAEARERGITATPTWLIDDRLVVPGAQPRETLVRWVERLNARAAD